MALMFFSHYLSTYPTILSSNAATITIYCDSVSIITRIN